MTPVRSAIVLAGVLAAFVGVPGASATPGNDQFASPTVLSGEAGHVVGNNYSATKEVDEPDHAGDPGGASVWFTWAAPRSGHVAVDTCGSDFDTLLAVYTGNQIGGLAVVASNNDACEARSAVEFDVLGGTAYRIAVDGVAGATGDITLAWAMAPPAGALAPPNDQFENATQLSGWTGAVDGTNLAATHQFGEPNHSERGGSGSLWYRWTAPGTGWVEFKTCIADFDTVFAAYRGASLAQLTLIGAGDDYCGQHAGGGLIFHVDAGASYAIVVDGSGPAHRGSFTLAWDLRAPPTPDIPPTVSGSPRGGQLLTGHVGQWSGEPPISFQIWWERCVPVGIDCALIPGSEGSQTMSIGFSESLRFAVRATNRGGSMTAYSARVNSPPPPPVNMSPPVIRGTPRVGEILRVVTYGEWRSEYPIEISEQWQRCRPGTTNCTNVYPPFEEGWEGGAYPLRKEDAGSVMRLIATASHIAGVTSAVSAPTGVVTGDSRSYCVVPRVIGKRLPSARKALGRSHCRLGKVRRVRSRRNAGLVVKQSPAAGKRVPAGTRVNVVVSRGRRR